jgi:hypothetical protein
MVDCAYRMIHLVQETYNCYNSIIIIKTLFMKKIGLNFVSEFEVDHWKSMDDFYIEKL